MTYADPLHCPGCGAPATGTQHCPRCGIQLRGDRALKLLSLLSEADRVLAQLRAEAAAVRARPAAPPMPQPRPAYGTWAPPAVAPPAVRARTGWSVGGTLLALGALCLVIAGFVFVAVGWGSLGLTGRTLVLVGLTVAVGACAAWVTTRRLRASAEALWTVCGLLAAVDVGAGRSAGVLGLGMVDGDVLILVFSAVLAVASLAVALGVRRWITRLVAAEVGLVVGLLCGTVALLVVLPIDLRWTLTAAVAGLVLATLGLARLRLPVAAWAVGLSAAAAVPGTALVLMTGVALTDGAATRWTHGDAPALLLFAVVVAALAVVVARVLEGRGNATAATAVRAAAGFVVAVSFAVVGLLGPDGNLELVTLTWVAVPFVAAVVGAVLPSSGWRVGVRAALAVAALPLVGALFATAGATVLATAESWLPGWADDVALRFSADWNDPVWLVALSWCGAAAIALVVRWWRVAAPAETVAALRRSSVVTAVLLGTAGALVVGVLLDGPVLVVGLAAVLYAGAASALWLVRGGGDLAVAAASAAPPAALAGALLPLGSAPASATTWSVSAVVAALVAVGAGSAARREAVALAGGAAAGLGVLAVLAWVDVAAAGLRTGALVAAVLAVALLAAASVPRLPRALRVPWEIVAAVTACVSLAESGETSLGWFSLCLTVLGVGASAVGLLRRDRRPYAVVGSVLLAAAYVTRLAASDVAVVEAYTLPFGLALLGAGIVRMRRERGATSTVLLPGLGLAVLPSLPGALTDPVSVRGLLLAAAGVALLGAGALVRTKAPFVVGAVLTTVLAVRWAGPLVGDMPRWLPLGLVGLALVLAGATWEARVRDARAVVAYVRTLR
ncbi:SCO7613 C-terminal domain-containing membrane protein [Mumia quercus]|uniref:SCO7613 C-terminal domain-containing membrane protein n=1 Tax=Mumia quercus TaxID=2976125 RepID=UPI0021CFC25F|nr:hypothetical protein [Mumia quercus]